ncbi:MAG: alpha/beta hydrolase [Alphaproteobacteria bacterium]
MRRSFPVPTTPPPGLSAGQTAMYQRLIDSGRLGTPLHQFPAPQARALGEEFNRVWNEEPPAMQAVEERRLPGPAGDIRVRLYFPTAERPAPTLIFIHGGGWVICSLDTHDRLCRRLAEEGRFAVASIDYRLAPEHRFPACFDDCLAAVQWLAKNGADWGLDTGRLALGGDSAGGNLTLATALALRDAGASPLKLMALIYGAFDLGYAGQSYETYGGEEWFLSTEFMEWFRNHYLNSLDEIDDWRASPLKADMAGLPPAYVNAAQCDPLHDDSIALCRKLDAAGVPYTFNDVPGVLHGFMIWTRVLDEANSECKAIAAACNKAWGR